MFLVVEEPTNHVEVRLFFLPLSAAAAAAAAAEYGVLLLLLGAAGCGLAGSCARLHFF
jgi:hypothetical protein